MWGFLAEISIVSVLTRSKTMLKTTVFSIGFLLPFSAYSLDSCTINAGCKSDLDALLSAEDSNSIARIIKKDATVANKVNGIDVNAPDLVKNSAKKAVALKPTKSEKQVSINSVENVSPQITGSIGEQPDVLEINTHEPVSNLERVDEDEWFYVGLADFTIGRHTGRDSHLLAPVKTGEYEETYNKGRIAFYLKGKVKGRYLITAALDTHEENVDQLLSNLDEKDPRQLLRRLDPDDYYPVYGDDSTLKQDAPTSGRFYFRIDKDDSHIMWGNFKAALIGSNFVQFKRGLYGAKADLKTNEKTSFGEPKAHLNTFAAQPGTLPSYEEFMGTGGSAYFLKHQDINQGSEQISIYVRDEITGHVLENVNLVEGTDYTIDYVQGVVILTKPLQSSIVTQGAVLTSSITSASQHLVVNYEYTPTFGTVDGSTLGARTSVWLNDAVQFGASALQENTGVANHTLKGVDATWRLSDKSYFKLEWAQAKGDTFASVVSNDGGFLFNTVSGAGADTKANAFKARAKIDFKDLTNEGLDAAISAGYESRDKGFNALGKSTPKAVTIVDITGDLRLTTNVVLKGKYDEVQTKGGAFKQSANVQADIELSPSILLQAGLTKSNLRGSNDDLEGTGRRLDAGARVVFKNEQNDKLFVFAQKTLDKDSSRKSNNRYGVGFEKHLSEKVKSHASASWGNTGFGLLAGIDYRPTKKDKYYSEYRLLSKELDGAGFNSYDPFGRDKGSIVFGLRNTISENWSAYSEHDYDLSGYSQGLTQTHGLDYSSNNHWSFGLAIEAGNVRSQQAANIERIAPGIKLGFKQDDVWFSTKLEARFEDSTDNVYDRTTWLVKSNFGMKYSNNWRVLAAFDAVTSNSDQSNVLDADYFEGSLGWAYRPAESDALNALFKYTYLHDLAPSGQLNAIGADLMPMQKSHILSADAIYDVSEKFSIGGKFGYRRGEVSSSRTTNDFTKSIAKLGIVRGDYHVVNNWDVFAEGRVLAMPKIKQNNYGFVAGVYRHMNDNIKVGVGYNFGQFSDDISDLTLNDEGSFLNVIGKF